MSSAKKRSSPGADAAKNGAAVDTDEITLSAEDAQSLGMLSDEGRIHELTLEKRAQEYMQPYYEKRRAILKNIPQFWSHSLTRMGGIALHVQHNQDQDALTYLEDLWLVRDKTESRCFTLEFHFKTNPYFSNTVLSKEYKYLPPPTDSKETPDANGITRSMLEFNWERDVAPQKIEIDWKDNSKNLTKLHPRVAGEDDDDMPSDPGSFFNYFTHADDPFDIGMALANDLFPDAIEYFSGLAGDGIDFDDDSEDDDEDNEEDEIDLEKPRKKQKTT